MKKPVSRQVTILQVDDPKPADSGPRLSKSPSRQMSMKRLQSTASFRYQVGGPVDTDSGVSEGAQLLRTASRSKSFSRTVSGLQLVRVPSRRVTVSSGEKERERGRLRKSESKSSWQNSQYMKEANERALQRRVEQLERSLTRGPTPAEIKEASRGNKQLQAAQLLQKLHMPSGYEEPALHTMPAGSGYGPGAPGWPVPGGYPSGYHMPLMPGGVMPPPFVPAAAMTYPNPYALPHQLHPIHPSLTPAATHAMPPPINPAAARAASEQLRRVSTQVRRRGEEASGAGMQERPDRSATMRAPSFRAAEWVEGSGDERRSERRGYERRSDRGSCDRGDERGEYRRRTEGGEYGREDEEGYERGGIWSPVEGPTMGG